LNSIHVTYRHAKADGLSSTPKKLPIPNRCRDSWMIAANFAKHISAIVSALFSYALCVGLTWWAENLVARQIAEAEEGARISSNFHVPEDGI
jgi:acyl-CoA thioesterase